MSGTSSAATSWDTVSRTYGHVLVGFEVAEPIEVGRGAEGPFDDRSDAGLDREPDPETLDGRDDVREQDRGVHAVAAHRLEGDLGGEVRGVDDRLEGVLLADRPVLREGAAGLPHEPDRDVVVGQPPAGPDEGGAVVAAGGDGQRGTSERTVAGTVRAPYRRRVRSPSGVWSAHLQPPITSVPPDREERDRAHGSHRPVHR
jgi:hypothetical protein